MLLTAEEVRVAGALMEKALATPQYYPLTLNALVQACNQTSNRQPVVSYDQATVQEGLAGLREQGLVRFVHSPSNRAPKYRHVFDERLALLPEEVAVLSVLMLRGPQTLAELRARTQRLGEHSDEVDSDEVDVEQTLDRLATRHESAFVTRLERRPGQKEPRYAHLLMGEEAVEAAAEAAEAEPERMEGAGVARREATRLSRGDALAAVEDDVRALREELGELRKELAELRALLE